MQKILHLGFEIPPPRMQKNKTYFFKASGIILSNFGKIHFFPLKKSKKKLRIFSENWSSEGAWPPSQREKFFFAFLDELDHSTHFLKNAENLPRSDPPAPLMQNFLHFFFFSYFVSLPNVKSSTPFFSYFGWLSYLS